MKAQEFIKVLEDLQNHLHDRTAWTDDVLVKLRDALEEYGLQSENYEIWDNYKTNGEFVEMIKDAVDSGTERLFYFLNEVDFRNADVMYIDNYWNCDHKVSYDELWNVIEGIIEDLEENPKE